MSASAFTVPASVDVWTSLDSFHLHSEAATALAQAPDNMSIGLMVYRTPFNWTFVQCQKGMQECGVRVCGFMATDVSERRVSLSQTNQKHVWQRTPLIRQCSVQSPAIWKMCLGALETNLWSDHSSPFFSFSFNSCFYQVSLMSNEKPVG